MSGNKTDRHVPFSAVISSVIYKKRPFVFTKLLNSIHFLLMPRSNPHTTEPVVPLPANLDCQSTGCSLQYGELCLICNIAFCHNHFLEHPCQQSTAASVNPNAMDWTSTLPEPVSKTYNSYNVSQKQIAIFAASSTVSKPYRAHLASISH